MSEDNGGIKSIIVLLIVLVMVAVFVFFMRHQSIQKELQAEKNKMEQEARKLAKEKEHEERRQEEERKRENELREAERVETRIRHARRFKTGGNTVNRHPVYLLCLRPLRARLPRQALLRKHRFRRLSYYFLRFPFRSPLPHFLRAGTRRASRP